MVVVDNKTLILTQLMSAPSTEVTGCTDIRIGILMVLVTVRAVPGSRRGATEDLGPDGAARPLYKED